MTTETAPPPSDDLRVIAASLIEVNQHLRIITGWMGGQEDITRTHTERMQGIESKIQLIYDVGRPYGEKIDGMALCMEAVARTLRGVTELAKSTFEIVTALKGGDHAGEESERKQAAAGP